jgi:hypothetical protein
VTTDILPGSEPGEPGRGGNGSSGGRTLVERVLAGDWRSAALVAGPTVLVAYVLGLVVNSYLIWIDSGSADDFDFLGHSNAGFFRGAAAITGMAFGTPAFVSGGTGDERASYHAGMAPLTVTLLTVLAFVFLLRRHGPAAYNVGFTWADRAAQATRAALITAVGLALLTIAMYGTLNSDGDRIHQSGSPGRVFGWSLLLFVVTALLVSVRRDDLTEQRQQTFDKWRLPVEGALVAMTTAILLGGVVGIVILVAQADGGRLDIVKALPILLGYLVNLGVDVFHVGMGGALHASFSGRSGGDASVSLFDRQGLSAAYLLLFFLPPISILVGVNWIHRYRGAVSSQELARACYRMAVPATLIYLFVAIPSRVGFGFSGGNGDFFAGGGGGHAGVQVLLGTLLTFGWFLVLGFAIGQWLLPRSAGADSAEGAPRRTPLLPRWLREGSLAAAPLVVVAGVVGVLCAAGGVATAEDGVHESDFGPASGLLLFGSLGGFEEDGASSEGGDEVGAQSFTGSDSPDVVPVTPTPGAAPDLQFTPDSTEATATLREYAAAEEVYFTENQTYTADPSELLASLSGASGLGVSISVIRADAQAYCIEAYASDGTTYSYDSTVGTVTPGTC